MIHWVLAMRLCCQLVVSLKLPELTAFHSCLQNLERTSNSFDKLRSDACTCLKMVLPGLAPLSGPLLQQLITELTASSPQGLLRIVAAWLSDLPAASPAATPSPSAHRGSQSVRQSLAGHDSAIGKALAALDAYSVIVALLGNAFLSHSIGSAMLKVS